LARHKRDTTTCDQRHSMTMTQNDADRLYSYTPGSWSQSLCHAAGGALNLPASSELIFADCAAAGGPWLTAEPNNPYDRRCSVNVIPSDGLPASSMHRRSMTSPRTQQVRIMARTHWRQFARPCDILSPVWMRLNSSVFQCFRVINY